MTDATPGPDEWLIVKRDLYFRPDCQGYTGIRDHAGRYSYDFAKDYQSHGCSIIKLSDAPEFSKACFDDLALAHLKKQNDALLAENKRLREALKDMFALMDEGLLVRDTTADPDPDWALRHLKFLQRLKKAHDALASKEAAHG